MVDVGARALRDRETGKRESTTQATRVRAVLVVGNHVGEIERVAAITRSQQRILTCAPDEPTRVSIPAKRKQKICKSTARSPDRRQGSVTTCYGVRGRTVTSLSACGQGRAARPGATPGRSEPSSMSCLSLGEEFLYTKPVIPLRSLYSHDRCFHFDDQSLIGLVTRFQRCSK